MCWGCSCFQGQIWSSWSSLSTGTHLELPMVPLPVTVSSSGLQMNSCCPLGWGEAAHPARGCGNVGLAAPPALGVVVFAALPLISLSGQVPYSSVSLHFTSKSQSALMKSNDFILMQKIGMRALISPHNARMIGLGTRTGLFIRVSIVRASWSSCSINVIQWAPFK